MCTVTLRHCVCATVCSAFARVCGTHAHFGVALYASNSEQPEQGFTV
jgi:hypothetical protein